MEILQKNVTGDHREIAVFIAQRDKSLPRAHMQNCFCSVFNGTGSNPERPVFYLLCKRFLACEHGFEDKAVRFGMCRYLCRMRQRKLHGACWDVGESAFRERCVCALRAESDVGYQIHVGYRAQAPAREYRVHPFIIPRLPLAVIFFFERIKPHFLLVLFLDDFGDPVLVPKLREACKRWVEMLPCSAPRRPAPCAGVDGKIIACDAALSAELEIVSADVHDFFIVFVIVEHLAAEREERWMREAVILEDDA